MWHRAVCSRQRQRPAQLPQSPCCPAAQRGEAGDPLDRPLTSDEEAIDLRTAHLRFDIGLLAERLIGATDWLAEYPYTQHLPLGYFGASTGAAAALVAATERPDRVGAIVSRGGRPDLAGPALARVRVPTLLIVAGTTSKSSS
jgi:dienelactone hydrolase